MRRKFIQHIVPVLTVVAVAFFGVFVVLNQVLFGRLNFHQLTTAIDRAIPFSAPWELVYFFTVIFPFLPVVYIRDRRYFIRIVWYFCTSLAFCYVCFVVFPVQMVRVSPAPVDFFSWGVRVNHLLDNPINCFPSFHVTVAFAVAFMIQKISLRHGLLLHALAVLVTLSVLFTKAHYFYDVVAGFFLAVVGYFVWLRPFRFKSRRAAGRPLALLVIPVVFFLCVLAFYVVYRLNLVPLVENG